MDSGSLFYRHPEAQSTQSLHGKALERYPLVGVGVVQTGEVIEVSQQAVYRIEVSLGQSIASQRGGRPCRFLRYLIIGGTKHQWYLMLLTPLSHP